MIENNETLVKSNGIIHPRLVSEVQKTKTKKKKYLNGEKKFWWIMKSMPIFTGLTQLETTTNPECCPLCPPLYSTLTCPKFSYPSHIIPPSLHQPRPTPSLLPSSNPCWISGFPHSSASQIKHLPGRRKQAGGERRDGYWFRLWWPFMKNTKSSSEYRERTWCRGVLLCCWGWRWWTCMF